MRRILFNQRGSIINLALLMIVLLSMIVIYMSNSTTVNVEIAANEKYFTTAFFNADSGAYGSAKVVGRAIESGFDPTFGNAGDDFPQLVYIVSGTNSFYSQVMGFNTSDTDDNMLFGAVRGDEDIEFQVGGREVNVGIRRTGQQNLAGGGAEFAAGSMGVGAGSAGGIAIMYAATSIGEGPKDSRAEIETAYRKIPGTAGGL